MSEYQTLIYNKDDGVATIQLNCPDKMNALSLEMREELLEVVQQISANEAIRAVILTGSGRAFCAGGDISTMQAVTGPLAGRERLKKIHGIITGLLRMEKPVIAAVNGYALGAGCNLALACDIIIAAKSAKFGQSFVNIGLVTDTGGAYLLPRAVGLHKAKELCFTGQNIEAREAERIGLVNRVVPDAELESTVKALAGKLAKAPTKSIALAKELLNKSFETNLYALLEFESFAQSITFQTEDLKEGVAAFLEKREPHFQGR